MKPKIKNLKILPLIIEQDELLNQTLKCRYKHTEIFLKDLACALYFKSFHYDYKVNASYLKSHFANKNLYRVFYFVLILYIHYNLCVL